MKMALMTGTLTNAAFTNGASRRTGTSFRGRLAEPLLTVMLDHWCRLRHEAGERTPPRRALDPMAIPQPALGHLQLHYREPSGRLRCRLSGTVVCRQLGRDATGRCLDEVIHPRALPGRERLFNRVLETGMPIAYSGTVEVRGRVQKAYKRLLLPFKDEHGAGFVLSVMTFRTVAVVDAQHLHNPQDVIEMTEQEAVANAAPAAAVA